MKDIIYQLEAVKTKCIWENMRFDADVLDGCIRRLNEIENGHSNIMTRLVDQNTLFGAKMKVLQDKLEYTQKELDAAISDMECWLSEGKTCQCCKHNFEDEETAPCNDNGLVYGCSKFEWRGLQSK